MVILLFAEHFKIRTCIFSTAESKAQLCYTNRCCVVVVVVVVIGVVNFLKIDLSAEYQWHIIVATEALSAELSVVHHLSCRTFVCRIISGTSL